jgi:RimJ/RimL family protein N-acetyltransferase
MNGPSIRLRPATTNDSAFLLELRNDPAVRRQSRSNTEVSPDDHARWLEATLADPSRHLFIIETVEARAGQLRLDQSGSSAEVSIALTPSARGAGFARAALTTAQRVARDLGIDALTATVREGNAASLQAFARAGYVERRRHDGFVDLVTDG